jgi:hypothetical protein
MKILVILSFIIMLAGCASDLKLSAYKDSLRQEGVGKVAILQLSGAAYPGFHNVHALKNMNLAQYANKALVDVIIKKRKKWKVIHPSTVRAADTEIIALFSSRKNDYRNITPDDVEQIQRLAGLLETRYFLVLENISIKDVSTPQVPTNLVIGACIQLWDFKAGSLVYRARSVSNTINYGEEDFKKQIDTPLFNLFHDLISPLPKH